MTLLDKYIAGNTVPVYEEIAFLGAGAFEKGKLREVTAVLTETMHRVAYNLEVIYIALKEIDYCFSHNPRYAFEYPLLKPRWSSAFYIWRLEKATRPFGYLPLSFKLFYKIVGSCNFAWDYHSNPEIPWEGADPIQIGSATDLLSEVKQLEPDGDEVGLPLAADHYHKDNISGGPSYKIELTEKPQIDSRFLNEEHNTNFINYLRIAFAGAGFSRSEVAEHLPDFISYRNRVLPLLKPI